MARLGCDAALARMRELGVAAVLVHDGASLAKSAYFTERRDVLRTSDPKLGELTVAGEVPKTYREPHLPVFRAVRPNEDRGKVL